LSRGGENWMIGGKGDRWRESYSHAYRGYLVRVKVKKICDKYGVSSVLIYGMVKRLCTVMHSSCVFLGWTGGKKF
jgi:dnaJ subfamily C member 5G